MEILSYVLEGGLEHKDSMGTGSVIRPGEIQFMRAGTGVTHSEYNHSKTDPVHFLQIWVVPRQRGLEPAYGQEAWDRQQARSGFHLLASGDGRDGSLHIDQDLELYLSLLGADDRRRHALASGRHAWVHVARGGITLNGHALEAGDGAALSEEPEIVVEGREDAEVLLFDLA